jgi:hypothetical protein
MDFFEFEGLSEKRARIAKAQEEAAVYLQWEQEQAAKRKEAARLFSLKANRDQLLAEYREADVKPPASLIGEDGYPTTSLSLLLWMGWKIEESVGWRSLVPPPPAPKGTGKKREDYGNSMGT